MAQAQRGIRRRVQLFMITTLLFIAGVLIIYGQRTGKLTIFGDVASLPGLVTVSSEVDLAKGTSTGDGNATVLTDEAGTWLTLAPGRATGVAQYDIGHRDITLLQRFKPLTTPPQPAGAAITVQVAGSLDGVAFGRLTEPQPLTTDTEFPQAIDLTTLLPTGSHFVRIQLTLSATNPAQPPRFAGFAVNYELSQANSTSNSGGTGGTVSADAVSATVATVNQTVAGTVDTPATGTTPTNLAATGVGDWVILVMMLIAIGGMLLLFGGRGFRGK